VAGDEYRKVAAEETIELLGKAGCPHALADNETVLLEGGQLLRVEAEIVAPAALRLERVLVEVIEELSGRRVPALLVLVLRLGRKQLRELGRRDLADLLQLLVEGRAIAEDVVGRVGGRWFLLLRRPV